MEFDVLIAGAGPAGCAAAISLADFAPELRICLAAPESGLCVGETVPPQIRPILEHLGVWSAFAGDRHCPSYRTVSAWGGPHLLGNEFLFQTQQVGWRLDRGRFDRMMRRAATARAASHHAAKVVDLSFLDGAWRIRLGDGAAIAARLAIDASGRAAALGRRQGMRPADVDRLIGCVVEFDGAPDDGSGLTIESFADGWWYSAAVPDGRRIIALMSDADLIRSSALGGLEGWMQALEKTSHVRSTSAGATPLGPPRKVAAGSRSLTGDTRLPLICVGDAAACFDPICGLGIVKALRSGIYASYAAADYLRRADETGLRRHRALMQAEFAAYRQTLREYYALERRWPERPFWRRRRDDVGSGAPAASRGWRASAVQA